MYAAEVSKDMPVYMILLIVAAVVAGLSALIGGLALWISSGGWGFSNADSRFLEVAMDDDNENTRLHSTTVEMGHTQKSDW